MSATPSTIGQRFAALRTVRGLKLRDIHERSGIAISYVSRLERGDDWSGVSVGRLARLARAVGTTPAYLLGQNYLDGVSVPGAATAPAGPPMREGEETR